MCVGIDLGGTYIKLALLDRDLRLCGTLRRPTPADRGPEGVIEAMVSAARELMEREGFSDDQVAGVGIGSPGPLDLAEGMVLGMPNIPGFDHVPLRDRVGEGLGLPAVLENDANAAALGEFLVGRGRDVRHMVMLTLGTGVGSGIVIDGRLLHGAHGVGAELGHLIVEADGEPCGCGQRGCLERYASATYLAEYARRLIESGGRSGPLAERLAANGRIDARDVQQARAAGDETAVQAWDRAVRHLAIGCVSMARMLDPEMIVFGGGMAAAGDDLMGPLRERFEAEHWNLSPIRTELAFAELGGDAGVIGAAGAAWRQFDQA